ncbi:unnamed protein product [Phytophthora fragariaefolia]|uniref:Unnamed protein product n=1 Tax=Phytophthora fragariaefolia TaxID=1490495 RepID=A0A9W7CYR4_9STRA|nr:unnamed protein product [Phytophthora fragariaefolia]
MVYSRSASTRAYIKTIALCAVSLAALPLAAAQGDATTTVCEVSDDLKSFGIRVVDGAGCANGGLGCYNDHCRYCKLVDTPESTQLESCSSFGTNFPSMAPLVITTGPCEISEGDATVGIAAAVDPACLSGGLGCFSDHCRFCKVRETPESTTFLDCADFNTSTLVTDAAITAPAPATVATGVPLFAANVSCELVVSEGDAAVGIDIAADASCRVGGVGCIDGACRFCRLKTTVQSAAFKGCISISGTTIIAAVNAPGVTPVDTPTNAPTEAPVDYPSDAPTELPTQAPSGSTCQQVASEGDIFAGVSIVTDTSCSIGGIGCISDVCRYCRVVYTNQSAAFLDCGIVLGTASMDASSDSSTDAPTDSPTSPPTDVPIDTPTATVVDTLTEAPTDVPTDVPTDAPSDQPVCSKVVSSGDASVGINIVTDTSCATGALGCIDDVCRFCKVLPTIQSSAFVDCTSIAGYSTSVITTADVVVTEAPTAAPTEAPTEAPTDSSTNALTDVPTDAPTEVRTDTPTSLPPAEA